MLESLCAPAQTPHGPPRSREGTVAIAHADREEAMVTESLRNRNSKVPARSALALVAFVAACSGVAFVGSSVTTSSIPGWY